MKKRCRTKLVHEGQYVAEVDVELIEAADEWSPYISLEDAYKRRWRKSSLRQGNVKAASQYGKVYTLNTGSNVRLVI